MSDKRSDGFSGKPNIILIHADSWDGRFLGCLPFRGVRTPNADRLAKQGVCFTKAYSPSPLCTPARACLASGQLPHRTEAWNFHQGLSNHAGTFETHLFENNYVCRMIGRRDFRGRGRALGGENSWAYVCAWLRSTSLGTPHVHADLAPYIQVTPGRDVRKCEQDWIVADEAVETIRQFGSESRCKPFYLSVGFFVPHAGHKPNDYWMDQINPEDIVLPPIDSEKHPVIEEIKRSRGCEKPLTEEFLRRYMHCYCAKVAETDALVGAILDAVESAGLNESTYIILTSDHGELHGDHNMVFKVPFYEGSTRVPLIVSGPGLQAGSQVNAPAALTDIFPTIMEMGGIVLEDVHLDGGSLLPECRGEPTQRPQRAVGVYAANDQSCNSYMLVEDGWKLIAYSGFPSQLFNLTEDPEELRNLATDRPDVLRKMMAQLTAVVPCEEVDRKVLAYEKEAFRIWRNEQGEATARAKLSAIYGGWDDAKERIVAEWLNS
jgi:arylsulfatase A-like enzyme